MNTVKILSILLCVLFPSFSHAETTREASIKTEQTSSNPEFNAKQKMLFDAYSKTNFTDPYDDWFDLTGWLINNFYGFIPVPMVITEPAVGYGGGLSLLFVDTKGKKFSITPNIYAVGGLYTENGTYAAYGGYRLNFKNDRIRWTGALGTVSANLQMNPTLDLDAIDKHVPIDIDNNITSDFIFQRADFRILNSNFFLGASYGYFKNKVKNNKDPKLSSDADTPLSDVIEQLQELGKEVLEKKLDKPLAMITPVVSYDSRDTIFTPNKGIFTILYYSLYRDWVGSGYNFDSFELVFTGWLPLGSKFVLGMFADYSTLIGNGAPYYMQPSVNLRGVPSFYYQGHSAFSNEFELRYDIVKRISILAIGGYGAGFTNDEKSFSDNIITAGGTGLRYLISAPFKMRAGFDVVWGPQGPVFYIQFGNGWNTRGGM